LKYVVALRAAAGAAVVMSALAGAAGAQAADAPFHCQASALRLTLGGQQTVEPVVIGNKGGCATAQATPPAEVPSVLTARVLQADTTFDAAPPLGTATGGLASAALVPTPAQLAQLPTNRAIEQLPNQTFDAPAPLAAALSAAGLATSLQLDIRDAVRALVPQPDTALIYADVLTARASVTCAGGVAKLDGSSRLAGVKLFGQDLALTGVLDQAVTLTHSQSINPSQLDVSRVSIATPLNGITQPLLAQVQAAIGPALAALPPISLPASVIDVKLTPDEQIRNGSSLIQRALHAQAAVGGQPLLDAVVGEAVVSATANGCAVAAGQVADQVLGCSDRKLVLVDVLPRGRRVKLLGYANRAYVGRRVAIRLRATGRVVAHARVRRDGSFATYAPAPAAAMLATHRRANRVRYRAEIGKELSLPLKLQRRLSVSSMTFRNGKVIIKGRVTRPLTTPVSTIRVVRRVSCHRVVLVARFKPRSDGTFSVTVKAPRNRAAAVYRLTTYVREKLSC
jgi:hypothetical protein